MKPVFRRGQQGSVTLEAALVLPLMAVFTLTLIWFVTVGIAHVQATDAARDAARAVARGEDAAAATAAVRQTAPDSAAVTVRQDGSDVTVTVTFEVQPPPWLLVPLPAHSVSAAATVEAEPDDAP